MAQAPQPQERSTATTAQDLADVYGTGMTTPPSTATTAQDLADVGYGTGMTTPAPAPDPFQEPAPYQKGRDFGASFPVTTPSGPPIPGVSGPPEQAGDPGAAPGQMIFDPSYMPPSPHLSSAQQEEISNQARLREIMANPVLRNIFQDPRFAPEVYQ